MPWPETLSRQESRAIRGLTWLVSHLSHHSPWLHDKQCLKNCYLIFWPLFGFSGRRINLVSVTLSLLRAEALSTKFFFFINSIHQLHFPQPNPCHTTFFKKSPPLRFFPSSFPHTELELSSPIPSHYLLKAGIVFWSHEYPPTQQSAWPLCMPNLHAETKSALENIIANQL